jgi:hypothetical protein
MWLAWALDTETDLSLITWSERLCYKKQQNVIDRLCWLV